MSLDKPLNALQNVSGRFAATFLALVQLASMWPWLRAYESTT
jgi:hypothetical protein